MNNITILKIGGAVLTKKNGSGELRKNQILNIANEIQTILKRKKQKLILILGGGGKVHRIAKKYNLQTGSILPGQISGAIKTLTLAKRQQLSVCDILITKLKVVPLETNNFFAANKQGKIIVKNLSFLHQLINQNYIPVLYGDIMYHPIKNFSILSGDKIAILLARTLKVPKIIFSTNVDGVFSSSKKVGDLKYLLPNIKLNHLKQLVKDNFSFQVKDITGEMMGKLKEILNKPKNTSVYIFNGLKKNNFKEILLGKNIGTKIS